MVTFVYTLLPTVIVSSFMPAAADEMTKHAHTQTIRSLIMPTFRALCVPFNDSWLRQRRSRKLFANPLLDPVFLLGTQEPAIDPALDSIEQFQPVLERWLGNGLPLIVAFLAAEKSPIAANMLRVNLELRP